MDTVVTPLDAADATAAEQAYQIVAARVAADLPDFPPVCRKRFFGALSHPWPGLEMRRALAYVDGTPAGYLQIELPHLDNVENASVELYVHPAHRRHGVGRALHEYALGLLRNLGRKRVTGNSESPLAGETDGPAPGTGFATAMGATDALAEVRRRLDITTIDWAALDELLASARDRADGYSVVRWLGRTPEEYVDDVAYLDGRLLEDAPIGDLECEPEQVDANRIRGVEAGWAARGRRIVSAGMRHEASGRLVAFTVLDLDGSTPWHAFQQITLVDPEHRGHRLGTIIKIENLRAALAYEPALRMVDTFNAGTNEHMISINEAMGFRPVDLWHNWQLTI